MDAAAIGSTAPVPVQPILHKLGVIPFGYGQAVSNRLKSVAEATLQFLVPLAELLAAGDSGVLSTIREQKHLLHHRSHCRYRRRAQTARPVLAQR